MGGGGKGGTTVATNTIDPRLQEGGVQTLAAAMRSASLPYAANRGITRAAFSPMQEAAFQGAESAANAFGIPGSSGAGYLPAAQTSASGFQGYSPAALFDESLAASMTDENLADRERILASYAAAANRITGTSQNIPVPSQGTPGRPGLLTPEELQAGGVVTPPPSDAPPPPDTPPQWFLDYAGGLGDDNQAGSEA